MRNKFFLKWYLIKIFEKRFKLIFQLCFSSTNVIANLDICNTDYFHEVSQILSRLCTNEIQYYI